MKTIAIIILLMLLACTNESDNEIREFIYTINMSEYEVLIPIILEDNYYVEADSISKYRLVHYGTFKDQLVIEFEGFAESYMKIEINNKTVYSKKLRIHNFTFRR